MLSRTLFMATAALGLLLAVPAAQSQSTMNPGANADTGQINRGGDPKLPSSQPSIPTPSREEIRAALMMTDPGTISLGEGPNASGAAQPETTGKGSSNGEEPGPIGSTMQTKPAKFSHRNDVIDRAPIMAMPVLLDTQRLQQVYQAVMADKTPAAADKLTLKPSQALPYELARYMHPLPTSIRGMPQLNNLDYVKDKDVVYLVTAQTGIVVDRLGGK